MGVLGPRDTVLSATLVVVRKELRNINPLSSNWTSDAGPGPAKVVLDMVRVVRLCVYVCVCGRSVDAVCVHSCVWRDQAQAFSSSPFLQTSDYQAKADVPSAHAYYNLTHEQFMLTLKPRALPYLSTASSSQMQFRVTLTADTFSNRDGVSRAAAPCGRRVH